MKMPQELIVMILVWGLIAFYLFGILSRRKKKDKYPDKKNKT
jgi:hypothetical protein